ncbi:MAG: hypothetical protein ACFFD2_03120 [Promethearchaeota archaeon]
MKILDEEKFQKNSAILKEQWDEGLKNTMDEINKLIKEDFYTGIWGFLFNKIIAIIYSFFFSKDIKEKILRQSIVLLEASKEYDGNSDEIVEKFFEQYLLEDPSFERSKKNHPKSPELKEIYKRSFIILVKETNILLHSEGENYDELYKNAYKTKEKAREATLSIIDDAKENLDFAVENKMINVNRLVQKPIIKILRKEIEIGRQYYEEKINKIFKN